MSGTKKLALWVTIIVVGVVVYRVSTGPSARERADAAFLTVYRLTPDGLLQACGAPDRDLTGRLVEDDGIRDIRYLDSSGRRLVFRFLGDDTFADTSPSRWGEIGVWANLAEPDGLGDAVGDADAVEHLGCLAKTGAAKTASETLASSSLQSGSLLPLAVLVLMPQTTRGTNPGQPGSPNPGGRGTTPGGGGTASGGGTLPTGVGLKGTWGTQGPPPKVQGTQNGRQPDESSEPPRGKSENPNVVTVPCVGFEDTSRTACEMVSSAVFLKDLDESLRGPNALTRLDELATRLTGRDFRIIQLPALEADRVAAIKAIFRLEIKTVNLVSAQLKADVAKLTPMKGDSPQEKARKLEEVHKDEDQRRQLWQQATEDSRPSRSMGSSDGSDSARGSRIHLNDSSALRQAIQVHAKNWKGF